MKKILALILVCCMAASLMACGSSEKPVETAAPEVTAAPETTEATTEATTEPEETEPAETESNDVAEKIAIAQSLIDEPVEKLYEAIGYPESSDYAPSCLTLGAEDGNLYYDGFIVYTVRNGENETVYYVE